MTFKSKKFILDKINLMKNRRLQKPERASKMRDFKFLKNWLHQRYDHKGEFAPDTRLDNYLDRFFEQISMRFHYGRMVAVRLSDRLPSSWKNAFTAARIRLEMLWIRIKETLTIRYQSFRGLASFWTAELVFQSRVHGGMLMDRISAHGHSLYHKIEDAIDWIEHHTKQIGYAAAYLVAFSTITVIVLANITAYEYSYNGKALGIVRDQEDVIQTVSYISDKLSEEYQAEISINPDNDITFRKVMGFGLSISNRDEVLNSFTYLQNMKVNAYALVIAGKQVGILDQKSSVETVLDSVKQRYVKKSDSVKYSYVGFDEEIKIKEIQTELSQLQNRKEVIDKINSGGMEQKVHVVEAGQTFSEIASLYNIKQSQLAQSNPEVKPEKLKIGQELILSHAVPLLTVKTRETATYIDKIEYEITYENTKNLYKGDSNVKLKGIKGEKEVVASIERLNGVEVSRTELSAKIIKEPVAQVVLVGTKPVPPLVGTGTFINPARGKLTSKFGRRWGRMHEGIDIGLKTGSDVFASDGGKVIYAGYDGAYGKTVRIDHGGNRVTTYAHLSKILVERGEKVFQGQHIADSGNTGRSTGPHLHFEIRINGAVQNPLKYVY